MTKLAKVKNITGPGKCRLNFFVGLCGWINNNENEKRIEDDVVIS